MPQTDFLQIKDLQANLKKLKFISSPLVGVTDHLLTRVGGSHVKPNVHVMGEDLVPLQEAIRAADLHTSNPLEMLDEAAIKLIGGESGLTPYGNLQDFGRANRRGLPFKGVTHGQMMFRKLAIIDKFGQAIVLPDANLRPRRDAGAPRSIYPCLSDAVAPSVLDNGKGNLNTIFQDPDVVKNKWPLSRFIELPPSINQDARINAAWVSQQKNSKGELTWQEVSEYARPAGPVWGESYHY